MSKMIASVTAFISLIAAILGFGNIKDTNSFEVDPWLCEISDSTYISEISIPGTHNTCALYEAIAPTAKCQSYTVKDQLDMGVRFIDIRGVISFKKINIVHGIILQGISLDEVLEVCYKFLEENPSEMIVLSLKEDVSFGDWSNPIFTSRIEKHIEENPDKWYTETKLPTLGEVRGKIVLFNRFNNESDLGIPTNGWRNNCSFTIDNADYKIHVQDYYNIEKIDDEWEEARVLYAKCLNETDRPHNLYINFLSGYIKEKITIDPVVVAEGMNKSFTEYMSEAEKGCYGITLFDFVTADLCKTVIDTNF